LRHSVVANSVHTWCEMGIRTLLSQRGLEYLMDSINNISKEYNIKINNKTKLMRISRQGNHEVGTSIEGQQV